MKTRFLAVRFVPLLVGMLLVVGIPVHAAPVHAVIFGGRGVGPYALGHDFSTYERALGRPTRTQDSDNAADARTVYYKRYGLYFFVKRGAVNGISVESPLLSTPEGVHVGTDRGTVTRLYGEPQALRPGNVVYPERGLGFTFVADRVERIYVMDKEACDVASGDLRIVPGARVGGMHVGGSVDFVLHAWGEPTKKGPFPKKPGVELWSYEKKGVIVIVADRRIDGLWVFSGAFRTDRNLHVGSPRAEVVMAYGKPKTTEDNMETYPDQGFAVFYEKGVVKQIYVKAPGAM